MDRQTQIAVKTGNGRTTMGSSTRQVARNVTSLAHDIVNLVELQAKLLVVDLKQGMGGAVVPAVVIVGGGALVIASLPVLVLALAVGLVEGANLQLWAALLIAGLAAAALGGVVGLIGWKWLTVRLRVVRRSQEELERNLLWIKKALNRERTKVDA